MKNHFVGTVEEEMNGDLKIEGYLFETPAEAREYMSHRLRRAVNRILTLTLGKFEAQERRNSREPRGTVIPLPLPMDKREIA